MVGRIGEPSKKDEKVDSGRRILAMSRRGWVRKGDDEGTRPESYPKFTARASNVAPAGALHLKRLLAIFMCTYVVIERERDVKAQNSEGPFQLSGGPKGPAQ